MRREDWSERLSQVLEASRTRVFAWGEHDCALHAADAVAAMTGVDHGADLRGKYSDAAGAVKALKRKWRVTTPGAAMDKLFQPVACALAGRGDIAEVMEPAEFGGPPLASLAVVDGALLICAAGVILRRARAVRCWTVV